MLGTLYLLKNFNNYFNRKIIRYTNLSDYLPVGDDGYFPIEQANFNPNDGVSTSHIIGSADVPFDESWNPDYCLYVENGQIVSRWFVIKSERTMQNQYKIRLKRDSVADYYDNVLVAPTYIEKGILKDDDPMIVANEGISFNQIKTKEFYLKDETKIPWIVCYLNQHERPWTQIKASYHSPAIEDISDAKFQDLRDYFTGRGVDLIHLVDTHKIEDKIFDENSLVITSHLRYAEITLPSPFPWQRSMWIETHVNKSGYNFITRGDGEGPGDFDAGNPRNIVQIDGGGDIGYTDNGWDSVGKGHNRQPLKNVYARVYDNWKNNWDARTQNLMNVAGWNARSSSYNDTVLKKYNGKKFYSAATGRTFTVTYRDDAPLSFDQVSNVLTQALYDSMYSGIDRGGWGIFEKDGSILNRTQQVQASGRIAQISVNMEQGASIRLDLLGTKAEAGKELAYQSQKQPYDIICFPLFNTTFTNSSGNKVEVIGNAGLNISRALSEQLGTANLYDIQVLPFCPARELIGADGDIDMRKAGTRQILPIVTDGVSPESTLSYCLFATDPFATFEINKIGDSIYTDDEFNVADVLQITDRKTQANCDMYRLSSPNYAASFEFNLAKCAPIGLTSFAMDKFKVDCCFRPYNPYVHIAPNFSFLYGGDYNDSRGLIFNGDFGLTVISNAWTDYQVQNKNYQNIFDRQIQNMDTLQGFQREQYGLNVAMGALMGGAIGAGVGGKLGVGWISKGILGGALGGAGAGFGGWAASKDNELNEKTYQENRQFSKDMFDMQLDNIKALPNTITHSASLTNNFKFYPILEYYTCTTQEKQAFKNKIRYNGMTVGRVDTIYNFKGTDTKNGNFVKGQIIRLEWLDEDSYLANDIYNEVNQGIFI